jgi:hypothetical protein
MTTITIIDSQGRVVRFREYKDTADKLYEVMARDGFSMQKTAWNGKSHQTVMPMMQFNVFFNPFREQVAVVVHQVDGLKPCRCGSIDVKEMTHHGVWYVGCQGCRKVHTRSYRTPAEAREHWNKMKR